MNALQKKGLLVLAACATMALASCGNNNPQKSSGEASSAAGSNSSAAESSSAPAAKYARENDDDVFERVLGKFADEYEGVTDIADDDQRFVAYARAEATLLQSGSMAITTTRGGGYGMTRIAPRTAPYVFFGNDSDKIKSLIMTTGKDSFIKGSDRAALLDLWTKAAAGEGEYDPAAFLSGKGYSLGTEYKTTFSTPPETLDVLATSSQADTEQMVNCVEGLIQYDNFGVLQPCMADEWEVSDDFKTYKFHIREGANWYNANRNVVAPVTADDFVASFQHMLDTLGGLEYLVDGVVKGVTEYLEGSAGFDQVGCYVDQQGKLVFELERGESFFITRLAYSCFMPMNRAFYESKGGKFGEEFDASAENYTYGKDFNNVLYNSAFIPTTWDATNTGGSIVLTKNEGYWDKDNVKVTKASWVYDDGSNVDAIYAATREGDYPAISLTEGNGTLAKAKADNLFEDYHYISDTDATTFFGGLNLNRGTFGNENGSCMSPQTEDDKILTHKAMQVQDFRRAILHGWDRGTWNAVVYGEDLKFNNLRNMYTHPEYVTLSKDVDFNGVKFSQGMTYGQMVQKFIKDVDGETHIDVRDGIDGWYNPTYATELMGKARKALANDWPADKKVQIDIVSLGTSKNNTAQAASFKEVLEKQFPNDIQVNIQTATNTADYYSGGYRTKTGAEENADIFYGSGWGPDYGDPSTYLDTFALGGYMLKVVGLY